MTRSLLCLCGAIIPALYLNGINKPGLVSASKNNIAQATNITGSYASTVSIPLGGNAFITRPVAGGSEVITDNGLGNWTNPNAVTSVYFRLGETGTLTLSVRAKVPSGKSAIKVSVNGKNFTCTLEGKGFKTYPVGSLSISSAGYYKVDIKGVSKTGSFFADVSDIIIGGTAT